MRIHYITNVRIPTTRAQGYAIVKMCEQFSLAGADVTLFIPSRRDSDNLGEPFSYYGIKHNFNIKTIANPDLLSRTFLFGKLLYWVDMISFLGASFLTIRPKKGDILYTRDYSMFLLFSQKHSLCLELHDVPKSALIFNYTIKKVKLFFVLNRYIKDELVKRGVDASRIHIVPSGVDVELFSKSIPQAEAREKIGLPQERKIVLYSGQFYPWKGVDVLAEAAKKLPEALFVFIGGTDPDLGQLRKKYGDIHNLMIESFKDRSLVPYYLYAADVLTVPFSAHAPIAALYTSPLKLFEYMATLRPVVASNLLSLKEVLNENNCFFAEHDNSDSLAVAIQEALCDESKSSRVARQAREDVRQYSWTKRAQNIIRIIQNL